MIDGIQLDKCLWLAGSEHPKRLPVAVVLGGVHRLASVDNMYLKASEHDCSVRQAAKADGVYRGLRA